MKLLLNKCWEQALQEELNKEYFIQILEQLQTFKEEGKTIYPKQENIFTAFDLTPIDDVKVIILGQDPYHGANQAHGLSFSVNKGQKIPPSLRNIYKELGSEYPDFQVPIHGDLTDWAQQGVLMLNTYLTVESGKPMSHKDIGWEKFTNMVIQYLSAHNKHLVFILWGKFAQEKERLIDESKHLIIKSAHPSPFSAHNGFFNSKPFSTANNFLIKHRIKPINWQINDETWMM